MKPILYSTLILLSIHASADQVFNDDLIVRKSLGVGYDIGSGTDFGFETLRLMENNLRIKFVDTSSTSSFPSNDWQLTANDSESGGKNKFSIDDVSHGSTPFTVSAGAPTDSLFVSSSGSIGIQTDSPARSIHVISSDSPGIRLQQDETAGLGAQTWDLLANEAGLTIRDITNGNTVPFKVLPGAAINSLTIGVDGVGMGIGTATHQLHVSETADQQVALIENTNTLSAPRTVLQLSNNGASSLQISNTNTAGTPSDWSITVNDAGSLVINNGSSDVFTLDATGNLTISGSVSDASDVDRKENFAAVNNAEILDKVAGLAMSTWNYRGDSTPHIGPMAQDFHHAFAVGPSERVISKVDADGVALASIQALHSEALLKNKKINELQEQNRELEKRLSKLELMLERL